MHAWLLIQLSTESTTDPCRDPCRLLNKTQGQVGRLSVPVFELFELGLDRIRDQNTAPLYTMQRSKGRNPRLQQFPAKY
jgi:hypothetical protein